MLRVVSTSGFGGRSDCVSGVDRGLGLRGRGGTQFSMMTAAPWVARSKGLALSIQTLPGLTVPCESLSHAVTSLFPLVSLGFFDDILIPPESLQQPAKLYPPKVKVSHRGAWGSPRDSPHSSGWPWARRPDAAGLCPPSSLRLCSRSTDLPVLSTLTMVSTSPCLSPGRRACCVVRTL